MNIELTHVTIRDLSAGYEDNDESGVFGYSGQLDIRPPYQREFIYKDKQRDAVIDTVKKNFPLNVMYWVVRDDGTYEVMDGQQRTISLCQYIHGAFSFENLYFHNLQDDQQQSILDYELMVYLCSGPDSEKLDWFRTINIAGEKLRDQELRNAVYHGPWVSDAKRYFSKTGCPAYKLGGDYMPGSAIRQDYLERVIRWISHGEIESYMAAHQKYANANEIWSYFKDLLDWLETIFPKKRKQMSTVPWGSLYNDLKDSKFDPKELESEVARLMVDEEVSDKPGIYSYVLTRNEKFLNLRQFTDNQRVEAYERQKGVCAKCGKHFELHQMHADHKTPWHKGGKTEPANCQMLCRDDNLAKGGS